MTIESLDYLRSQISSLSESERAQLARELIMSLDGPREDFVGQAWGEEIERRISSVKDGSAKLLTRDEFRQRIRDRIDPLL